MMLLRPTNFSKFHLNHYNNYKEFLDFLFENINYLVKHINKDKLNNFIPSIFLFLLKSNIDFLKSFGLKINNINLIHLLSIKQLNHEELNKVYNLKNDLEDESYENFENVNLVELETDLIERRLILIDYLSEDVKSDLFRKDKDELFKLNLDQLDDVFITRLIDHFFNIKKYKLKLGVLNFMNLNSILRTYSKFRDKDIHFLDSSSKLDLLNYDFFDLIINSLPDSYFQNYLNLEKLNRIFFSSLKMEDNFNLLKKYQPNLTTVQLVDLLSLNPNAKNFKSLIPIFFKTFDLDSIDDKDQAYQLLFNFIELMPKNSQSIENYIKKSMFQQDQMNEEEFIKNFLIKESMSNSSKRVFSNFTIISNVLKCDKTLIKKQLKRHPNAKKTNINNLPLIVDYLLKQELTVDQIKDNSSILLYSYESIKLALDSLKQDQELYERVKTKDNFIDYLLYFLEKNSSFTGNGVFLNKLI